MHDETTPELSSGIELSQVGKMASVAPAERFFDDKVTLAQLCGNNWALFELFEMIGYL
jgi:hypothetical protein